MMMMGAQVKEVRWINWSSQWISSDDDDSIRLWNVDGEQVHCFSYNGGSVYKMVVDSFNQLILTATLDKCVRVFDLKDPIPKARYVGHEELVCDVTYIARLNLYGTVSWDQTFRLWQVPEAQSSLKQQKLFHMMSLKEEQVESKYVSNYETENPLLVPESLKKDQRAMFQSLGIGGDKQGKKKGRRGKRISTLSFEQPEIFSQTPLGGKLDTLNKDLLTNLLQSDEPTILPIISFDHLHANRGLLSTQQEKYSSSKRLATPTNEKPSQLANLQ
eukprot:TRINITY_DN26010_c1_g1_i3.p1 TRINITY_DN26010_c1_g1~~TRINITY_DN26010_c1_g1_i3.p1  ORF type:complete len:273 (+),score=24.28 TRINITY_DN26010_c1_g1_i3:172-990(+)